MQSDRLFQNRLMGLYCIFGLVTPVEAIAVEPCGLIKPEFNIKTWTIKYILINVSDIVTHLCFHFNSASANLPLMLGNGCELHHAEHSVFNNWSISWSKLKYVSRRGPRPVLLWLTVAKVSCWYVGLLVIDGKGTQWRLFYHHNSCGIRARINILYPLYGIIYTYHNSNCCWAKLSVVPDARLNCTQ